MNNFKPKSTEEVEKNLMGLLSKYDLRDKFSIEEIKTWIFNEETDIDRRAFGKFLEKFLTPFSVKNLDELNSITSYFTDAWNYFPHKSLGGISPYQKTQEYHQKQATTVSFRKEIKSNLFFEDFLFFLETMQERPIELTYCGNLKIKEIEFFQKNFKTDIFKHHRDKDGKLMWAIRHEYEVPYLEKVRLIAEIMFLTYKRRGKLMLSKNGRGFLEKLRDEEKFEQMVLWYFNRANWAYGRCGNAPEILQKFSGALWHFFNELKDEWINFQRFTSGIITFLNLPKDKQDTSDPDSSSRISIRYSLMFDLKLFDMIERKMGEVKHNGWSEKEIIEFRLTPLGKYLIAKLMEPF